MNYIILLLAVFVFILLIKNFKNQYTWVFLLMSIGISISLFALIIYVSKLGNYRYPSNNFFMLDYKIFIFLSNVELNFYMISRLLNIGIAVFLFSVPLVAYEYTKQMLIFHKGRRIAYFAALGLLPVFFVWFYDPETSFTIYTFIVSNTNYGMEKVLRTVNVINYAWILTYLYHPAFLLYRQYKNTGITIKKRQITAFGSSLMVLNSIFVAAFMFGPFKEFYMVSNAVNLLKFSNNISIPKYYYNILPAAMLLILLFIIILIFRMGLMDSAGFFTQRAINKNIKALNENMRVSMHSFKNTIFTFKILAEQAESEFGTPKGLEAVKRIQQVSETSLAGMTRMLNMMKEIRLKPSRYKLFDSIEAALKKCNIPKDIVVKKQYLILDVYVYFDFYHLTEAFVNLIQNAVDALKLSSKRDKIITIYVNAEYEWVEVNIADNGCGIGKNELKNIFNPFYSTKTDQTSWGIGLSFTYRVIKAHLSYITVDSKENEYTSFKIFLPRAEGRTDIE